MSYFTNVSTVEEIKSLYRTLARENHPDLGGDTATMQEINSQYHEALKRANGQESKDDQGKVHRYKYDEATEQAIMDKISELLALNMDGVEVVLIGLWVWITGDTKPHKEKLGKKGLGCSWHSKRGCWYWKPYKGKSWGSSDSLDGLASKYGYEKFKNSSKKALK